MSRCTVPKIVLNLAAFGVRESVFRPVSLLLAMIQISREKKKTLKKSPFSA